MNGILQTEIHEQPQVIERLIDEEAVKIQGLAEGLRERFQYVLIAARGTSDNAARYAQYLFGAHNRLQVALATPSLFTLYHHPPRLKGALVVGISQSGQSPDIIEVVAEGRRQGQPTIALTNDPTSPLAEAAECLIELHAGPERAVAATKTYTASLAAMALLSAALAGDEERLSQLKTIPEMMRIILKEQSKWLGRVERYRYMDRSTVIGRGYNYSTAFEIALKIKELTRVITEPYSSADFRHGPIAMVWDGFPVILVAPSGSVFADIHQLVAELIDRRAELLVISDDQHLLEQAQLAMPLPPGVPEWLTPLVAVLPGQLFGMALAEAKGLNPDLPIGLTKVTETL